MEIVIRSGWESITLNFESKVPVNTGKLKSLSELVTLKDIEKEVREYLNLTHWRTMVMPGMSKTTVNASEEDFHRIRTIVKRDNIIENILNNDK